MTTETADRRTTRTPIDIPQAQVAAIDAWNAARRASEAAVESTEMTREMRLDVSRRTEARRREHAAHLSRRRAPAGGLCAAPGQRTCPGGHRPPERMAAGQACGAARRARRVCRRGVEDGADAAGAVVVEQPELVFVEDRLPTLPGPDVLRSVRAFSPLTLVGVHVLDSSGVEPITEAGAQAVFTRRIPPVDIADQLVRCLQAEGRTITLD